MIAQVAKGTGLVFVASIAQVSILNRMSLAGGRPGVLLVTLVALALVGGALFGAGLGFFAGLLVDTATLGTLGVTSLVLSVLGYWTGRYGETTGRSKPHAPFAAVGAATTVYAGGALGLRSVLGEHVDGVLILRSLPVTLACNLILAPLLYSLCRQLLGSRGSTEGVREVRLLG